MVYAGVLTNNGSMTANGVKGAGSNALTPGGASGGGSINLFYKTTTTTGTLTASGGKGASYYIGNMGTFYGGAGGAGCISKGNISNGTYVAE